MALSAYSPAVLPDPAAAHCRPLTPAPPREQLEVDRGNLRQRRVLRHVRQPTGDSPQSVKCSGTVTVLPSVPPSHTYTRPRSRFLYVRSKRMATRWPVSGWKGWVISSDSESLLCGDAVWRDRGNP